MHPNAGFDGFPGFPSLPNFDLMFIIMAVLAAIGFLVVLVYYLFMMKKISEGRLEPVGFVGGLPIFMKRSGPQAYCPRCGAAVSLGWRYCPSCGYDLSKLRERGQ